ncbi:hypothetical protein [Roseobacter sinensis]|uniref:Lipoprotein n=1 Tax=Roseobacter sinensis TaxID=2931391 RepID=A0ABT3BCK6_9RHOB|nr:hypothetical protein [Roseobacter sp. WL0113]MCV3271311.1 hypothetical protein [Roseobacter sp. WL0113]
MVDIRRWATLLVCILAIGCTVPGSAAFQDYAESYDAAREASLQVVDAYNQYDKMSRRRQTDPATFDPDFADVYAPTALSPISLTITEGFAAATTFNEVLARYADNDTLRLQKDEIERLNAASANTATLVAGPGAGGQVRAVIGATQVLANLSQARADRDAFVRNVRENTATVDAFLKIIRDDTADMYQTARLATALSGGSVEKLETFRGMLATWVLLIDQTRKDLDILRLRVEAGADGQSGLSLLSESAVRIDRHVTDIDAAYTALVGVF